MIDSPLDDFSEDDFRDEVFREDSRAEDSADSNSRDESVGEYSLLADERLKNLEALLRRSQPQLEASYGLRTRVLRAASQARVRQELRWKRRYGIITGVLSASLMLLTPLIWASLSGNLGADTQAAPIQVQNQGIPSSAFGPGGGTFEWSLVDFSFADRELRSKRFRGDL